MDEIRSEIENTQRAGSQELSSSKSGLGAVHNSLQELIGLHRQLLDIVRQENAALVQADTKNTFEVVAAKEALLHWIHQAETNRQSTVFQLAERDGLIDTQSTLREVINSYQKSHSDEAKSLELDLSTLQVLVERIQKQNKLNEQIVEQSLKHLNQMKKNVLNETHQQPTTYTSQGQAQSTKSQQSRLVSKEV